MKRQPPSTKSTQKSTKSKVVSSSSSSSNSDSDSSSSDSDSEPQPPIKSTTTKPTTSTMKTTMNNNPSSSDSDSDSSSSDSDSSSSDSDSDSSDDDTPLNSNSLVQLPKSTTTTSSNQQDKSNQQQKQPKDTKQPPIRTLGKTEVWLDIQVPPFDLGRVVIELYPDCPLAYENFRSLCTGEVTDPYTKEKLTYAGTMIDRIDEGYIVLGEICDDADDRDGIEIIEDDFDADKDDNDDVNELGLKSIISTKKGQKLIPTEDDELKQAFKNKKKDSKQKVKIINKDKAINIVHDVKKPAVSIYGGFFPDEPAGLIRQHVKAGTVSMFSEKTNRNGSKFLITLKPHMKWLDGQYTVIGQVTSGLKSLHSLQAYKDTEETAVISNCGRLKKLKTGIEKENDFLQQALEMKGIVVPPTKKGNKNKKNDDKDNTNNDDNNTNTNQDENKKQQILCEKCQSRAKYNSRQLGKGCKYRCTNKDCLHVFFLPDTKYDAEIITKAVELKKQTKQELHQATILLQNKKFRQELHEKEKLARKSGQKTTQDTTSTTPSLLTKSKSDTKKLRFASPQLAIEAQQTLAPVVSHKREKAQKYAASRKEHEEFVKQKAQERGEYDEDGNDEDDEYNNGTKRKYNHQFNQYNNTSDEVIPAHRKKQRNGRDNNNNNNDTRELKKAYNNPNHIAHKEIHDELNSMSKDSRRQFRKEIGAMPGQSKTLPTNTNKRHINTSIEPKKATFKSIQHSAHMMRDGQNHSSKPKDKSRRTTNVDEGFVSRKERRAALFKSE